MYSSSLPCPPPSPNISHKRQPYYSALAFCLLFVVCCLLLVLFLCFFYFCLQARSKTLLSMPGKPCPYPNSAGEARKREEPAAFPDCCLCILRPLPGGVRRGGMGLPGQQQTFFHLSDIKESNIFSGDDALPRTVGGERGGEDRCSVIRS